MTNINPKTQDLIDFIKFKYNIDASINIFNTKNISNKIIIHRNLIDNLASDYFILELLNGQMEINNINNNTNSTKFLTFILNPNTSISFLDINKDNKKMDKKDNDISTDINKDSLPDNQEQIKKYKLISYVLGVIIVILIIVIIYLLFIKDKKQE
jgi:hypothetical protein